MVSLASTHIHPIRHLETQRTHKPRPQPPKREEKREKKKDPKTTHLSNLPPEPVIHQLEHRVAQERAQQPSHAAAPHRAQAQYEERVQTEDIHGFEVQAGDEGDAAGGREEGGEEGGGEVVAAARLAEGEVGVPG